MIRSNYSMFYEIQLLPFVNPNDVAEFHTNRNLSWKNSFQLGCKFFQVISKAHHILEDFGTILEILGRLTQHSLCSLWPATLIAPFWSLPMLRRGCDTINVLAP